MRQLPRWAFLGYTSAMNKILFFLPACMLLCASPVLAWMGFDADTAELVEITPETVPSKGETIVVHDISTNGNVSCLVREVVLSSRTVEVRVSTSEGKKRVLIMESR